MCIRDSEISLGFRFILSINRKSIAAFSWAAVREPNLKAPGIRDLLVTEDSDGIALHVGNFTGRTGRQQLYLFLRLARPLFVSVLAALSDAQISRETL